MFKIIESKVHVEGVPTTTYGITRPGFKLLDVSLFKSEVEGLVKFLNTLDLEDDMCIIKLVDMYLKANDVDIMLLEAEAESEALQFRYSVEHLHQVWVLYTKLNYKEI